MDGEKPRDFLEGRYVLLYKVKVDMDNLPSGQEVDVSVRQRSYHLTNGRTEELELETEDAQVFRDTPGFEVTSVAAQQAAKTRKAGEGGESA